MITANCTKVNMTTPPGPPRPHLGDGRGWHMLQQDVPGLVRLRDLGMKQHIEWDFMAIY